MNENVDDFPLTPLERTLKEMREVKARLFMVEAERDDYRQRYEALLKKEQTREHGEFEEQEFEATLRNIFREVETEKVTAPNIEKSTESLPRASAPDTYPGKVFESFANLGKKHT